MADAPLIAFSPERNYLGGLGVMLSNMGRRHANEVHLYTPKTPANARYGNPLKRDHDYFRLGLDREGHLAGSVYSTAPLGTQVEGGVTSTPALEVLAETLTSIPEFSLAELGGESSTPMPQLSPFNYSS